ncbi:hypothetical protein LXA43DRAFT_1162939 [Ganoderma leucocontextum]|nr:hypothetical protein LXA43DRAFT_1162939 [Ganoderma leucocontextum]
MSGPHAHDSEWPQLCNQIVSLLALLEPFVPARTTTRQHVFPHILHTRTSPATPDKYLNNFIQSLADICAYGEKCDIFASAIETPYPNQQSDTHDATVQDPAGRVLKLKDPGTQSLPVYYSSNRGVPHELQEYLHYCFSKINELRSNSDLGGNSSALTRDFVASLEREIAVCIYRQCFGKVIHRTKKKSRGFWTFKSLDKFVHKCKTSGASSEDQDGGARLSPDVLEVLEAIVAHQQLRQNVAMEWRSTAMEFCWIAMQSEPIATPLPRFGAPADANLALFVQATEPDDGWVETEFATSEGGVAGQGAEGQTGPTWPPTVDPDVVVPNDDQLFLLYESGLAISRELRNPRLVKNIFETTWVKVDSGYTTALRVLQKVSKLSQAVDNIICYALRHSVPGVRFKPVYLEPLETGAFPCRISLDGETLSNMYKTYQIPLTGDEEALVYSWGQDVAGDRGVVRNAVVHAEVNVVAQLINNGVHGRVYPFIGCTKLSCYPCDMFFKALRDKLGCDFHTQGGHERIYGSQWYPPALNERHRATAAQDVLKRMIHDVLLDIVDTRDTYPTGGLSDSTGESGGESVV